MANQFDTNKYKKIFEQRYGAGSFDTGLSQARQIGQLKGKAAVAKTLYDAKRQAEKDAADANKYNNIFPNTPVNTDAAKQIDEIIANPKKKGAFRNAEDIKNDPSLQQEIKNRGYSVNDFIDAMYNAASGGQFKSSRQFSQYESQLQKDTKAANKAADEKSMQKHGMNVQDYYDFQQQQKKQKSQQKPQSKLTLKSLMNAEKKVGDQFVRFTNRVMDPLGIAKLVDKKIADVTGEKKVYTDTYSKRKGAGGVADKAADLLSYLAPAGAAEKGLSGITALSKLGAKGVAGKAAERAIKGGITGAVLSGAETGLDAAANPKEHNLKQDLKTVGLNTALGAALDPALYGAGQVVGNTLAKFAKGEVPTYSGKPSDSVLDALKPKTTKTKANSDSLYDSLMINAKQPEGKVPTGKAKYEAISAAPNNSDVTAPNPKDGHGYGLIDTLAPNNETKNTFDYPYKPGDPLPDTRSQIGTKTQRTLPTIPEVANKGYIKTVDNLHRLSQFDKQVENVLGRDLKPSESTHTLGLNSRGSDMISKQILTQNMVDKNGTAVGKSLKEITMKIPKGKLNDFEDYLVNKHAVTRMERGEKVFADKLEMSPAKSEAIVKKYEEQHPEFKKIADEYYEYNKQLGQKWLVDTGILSKKQWKGYLEANPYYVPNNRIFSDLEKPKFGNNAKKGFANQTNPIKAAPGSQRPIVSPIESTIEHTAQYIKTAKRNEVMQTLINNIKKDPEAFKDWAEIVPTDKLPENLKMDMKQTLEEKGVDGIVEEFDKLFNQKQDLTKGNIIRGLIDGNPVHVRVNDPALLDALTNLQPKAQNIVINALGQVTRIMKNLTTGINPVFSLTRNIFRDIPTAFVNSKSTNNPFVFSKDLVQSVVSVMKNDELYRSFKAVGGGHSSPISSDINLLAQSKRSILPGEKGLVNTTKRMGGKTLGALENLNNAVESAPRLAEFKRLSGDSYDSKMKALYEANDVTVNFNKYGNVSKEVDQLIPYFNAAMQGLDKLGRTFFSHSSTATQKTAAAVKAFSAITIPSIIAFAYNHNDPNYQKVSNYIKDTNILIPKGDGTFFKIPKPRELGIIFGSDVERVLRAWADGDPNAFQDFATSIKESFTPPIRSVLSPVNDLRANKNFMNAPIIPSDLQNVPSQYQYDSKTSEVSKTLGKLFNFSPMKSDYLIKSYGGVLGELGIPLTAKASTVGNTLTQKVTADPVFSNDIQRRFYDAKTKVDQAHNVLTKQGEITPNLNEGLRKQLSTANTAMGKVRKQMKQVQNDTSLTPQERQQKLRQYQDYINTLALQAMQNTR